MFWFGRRFIYDVTFADAMHSSLVHYVCALLTRFFFGERGEMKYRIAFAGGLIDGDRKISAEIAFDVGGFVARFASTPGVYAN